MKEVALEIRSGSLANLEGVSEAKFYRVFLKINGSEIELIRTPDCPRHFITRDHTVHYCVATDKEIHKLSSPPECFWMCTEICPFKKRMLEKELEDHGAFYKETIREAINVYLRKDDTITWAISSDG